MVAIDLFAMICLLDPKEIVIGGSVAVKNGLHVERIKAVLNVMPNKEQMHILPHIQYRVRQRNYWRWLPK